jgi:hypothetical protein
MIFFFLKIIIYLYVWIQISLVIFISNLLILSSFHQIGFILPTPVILIKSQSDKNINVIFMTSCNVIRNQKKKPKHTGPALSLKARVWTSLLHVTTLSPLSFLKAIFWISIQIPDRKTLKNVYTILTYTNFYYW